MIRIMYALGLVFFLTLAATPAAAQYPGFWLGSWCSATTPGGRWAFYYGVQDINATCSRAQAGLRYWGPIDAWRSGYFSVNGWNTVNIDCAGVEQTFWGYGVQPLQRGLMFARRISGEHCFFFVSY